MSREQDVTDDRMVRRVRGAYLGVGPGAGRRDCAGALPWAVVSPIRGPDPSATRGCGMVLIHTVLVMARPRSVRKLVSHAQAQAARW